MTVRTPPCELTRLPVSVVRACAVRSCRGSCRGRRCASTRSHSSSGCTVCGRFSSSTTPTCGTRSESSRLSIVHFGYSLVDRSHVCRKRDGVGVPLAHTYLHRCFCRRSYVCSLPHVEREDANFRHTTRRGWILSFFEVSFAPGCHGARLESTQHESSAAHVQRLVRVSIIFNQCRHPSTLEPPFCSCRRRVWFRARRCGRLVRPRSVLKMFPSTIHVI